MRTPYDAPQSGDPWARDKAYEEGFRAAIAKMGQWASLTHVDGPTFRLAAELLEAFADKGEEP